MASGIWPAPVFKDTRVLRPAYAALASPVLQQLLLQRSTGLNEQAAVHGFVGHRQALLIGIRGFQPAGNLLGRPVQNQFTRNDVPQLRVDRKRAAPGGARPTARLRRPLDWRDTPDGHPDVRPLGSRSIPLALNIWQSHASTNRKPAREERTPPDSQSKSPRNATPDNEWRNVLCQKRARSHAASVLPSNDATRQVSAPRKAPTVSLVS